jgi:predicted PurR-regulated permease PerM
MTPNRLLPDTVPVRLVTASEVAWRSAAVLAVLGGVVWSLYALRLVTVPVFIALLVTTVLRSPADALRRRGWRDLAATWAVLVGAGLLVAGTVAALAPAFVDELGDVGPQLDEGLGEVEIWLEEGPLGVEGVDLRGATEGLADRIGGSERVVEGVTFAGELLAGGLLALVMTFFFVKDGHRFVEWIGARAGAARRPVLDRAATAAWQALGAYVRGTAVVGVVNGTIIGIGLAIIGVPLALPLAVITAVSSFFPLVGAVAAGAVAALVALVSGGPVDALLVLGLVVVVQQVEGDVLSPIVVGRALRLHPLVVLVAVTAGAVIAGLLGAFLAVPLVGVIAAIATSSTQDDPLPA